MDRLDHLKDLCLRMEDIAAMAGLPRYDRVRYDFDAAEAWFLWEERKLAIVVEMSDTPEKIAAAVARATAGSGDPVLN
jgi:hypothetical protein